MPDLTQPLTQTEFGALVGISQPAASGLISRGVIDEFMTGQQALHAYCSHLREQAAGRATTGKLNLADERAALAREQRIRVALENAVTLKELAPVGLLQEVLSMAGSRVAGILDGIPGAVRRRVPSLTAEEIGNISAEIARVRNIAASVSLADLRPPEEDEPPEVEGAA